ncbi:MAG TPA: radical SAM protein, partial [Nitrospirales bacterium]|nr:radical SAM protein [Nitrospirales bacterium]
TQLLVEQNVGIKWTTLIRFEETLQDSEIWKLAAQSGCCTLYYGMESANERVLNLMDKHVKQSVIVNNLREAAKVGIWNHVMAFYGFPGETREEAKETRQFLLDNKEHIHSVELFYFVAYRHTPMVRTPEKFGITIHKQEEYDLPLDYYYTLNEPGGVTCLEAMRLCEEFYQNDFAPWAVRVNAREHVFLYISKFGTNRLSQIYAKAAKAGASVSGLVTWPVARGDAEADSEQAMARVHSHAAP